MIEDDFPFPTVGCVSSQEGIFLHQRQLYASHFALKEKTGHKSGSKCAGRYSTNICITKHNSISINGEKGHGINSNKFPKQRENGIKKQPLMLKYLHDQPGAFASSTSQIRYQ